MALVFANHIPYQICILLEQVLHIYLLPLVAGEGSLEIQRALLDPFLQLSLIYVVLAALAAAEVQNRLTHCLALIAQELPFLDEAAERRQACTWTNHDDGRLRLRWQTELRFSYENRHLYILLAALGLLVL